MKGINFKKPLFNATIERRKTETRRIMVPQPIDCTPDHPQHPMRLVFSEWDKDDKGVHCPTCGNGICIGDGLSVWKPRYKVGDVVYLKEPYAVEDVGCDTFKLTYQFDKTGEFTRFFTSSNVYEEDWASIHSAQASMAKSRSGFANKLFMPEWVARYFIRITAVRAERLQEIDDAGCIREGIVFDKYSLPRLYGLTESDGHVSVYGSTLRKAYAALIDQINGRGTWDSNPFVWVYGYELVGND